jgi:hypothetical protein
MNLFEKLGNLLKPALILAVVSGCLLFTSCKYVDIEQYKDLHDYCNDKYLVGTKVWVKQLGCPISLESWEQEDVNRKDIDKTYKKQKEAALKIKIRIEACLNNR